MPARRDHLYVVMFDPFGDGPSIVDRLLALDTLFLNATCLVVILGIYWASTSMFEGALLVAMLGFVSTAALARYFTTGHVVD